ncbi:hypothetical protein DD238_002723 [Peronospora effusa]|uniref:Uncharacterized protein n=1 Tax=Peronospora effusa TaxID=542832 RepID=A0A3M6VT98_9STRA|nr:hypothetical protein DD238_002723 [Peronospora effusa]RQM09254.1 hypothetical protein DD237_006850 [Peronospora effusa]
MDNSTWHTLSNDVKILKREQQRADDTEVRHQEVEIEIGGVKFTLQAQHEWLQQQQLQMDV